MKKYSGSILIAALILILLAVLSPVNLKWTKAMSENTDHKNRLADEKSPYLLQHADNPVDWYPWGDEAFEKAKRENKPIFLSIGYSTCHWCHVMEHESFEDDEVAALMNDAFVSIKVDREERPDIDNIYMTVCRMMTGGGGWPLTIIMTPDKKPFFAGTYIPKQSRYGRTGMIELIPKIKGVWNTKREELEQNADRVIAALDATQTVAGVDPDESVLHSAFNQFKRSFDKVNGGFGGAPKFPSPHNLIFLLRYWNRTGENEALEIVEKTLTEMRKGGIYDQVGYGFHRYSTDSRWLLPHFEKMLYDQALLIMAYTELYLATGKKDYEQTAREIITYVLRDMTDAEGGFYSAEDADSDGEEGKFYVWSEQEIRSILGKDDADLVVEIYNIEKEGNFVEQTTGRKTGHSIPHLNDAWVNLAARYDMPQTDIRNRTRKALDELFNIREKRIHPYKDDKILSDWNGLMIAALASAGRAFDAPNYIAAAKRAADFILAKMITPEGRLSHRYREGQAGIPGNIDDYAFVVFGLIELYQATFEIDYLEKALEINDEMIGHFQDTESGGFYFTADDAERLLVRQKEFYDGAVPSGNSVAAYNLIRLARITGRTEFEEMSSSMFRSISGTLKGSPTSYSFFLSALDFALGPSAEIVIAGDKESNEIKKMVNTLNRNYIPNKVVVFVDDNDRRRIESIASFVSGIVGDDGDPKAYICRNFVCDIPANNAEEMLEKLKTWRK